jgi:hypothetical protein
MEHSAGEKVIFYQKPPIICDQGLLTVIVDAPSDRQSPPFLTGFRQTEQHVSDIKAVIAWVREGPRFRCGLLAPAAERNRSLI